MRAAGKAGRIDVLCNNAAYITDNWHKAGEAPDEEWERSFRVSLLGTQHFTREALRGDQNASYYSTKKRTAPMAAAKPPARQDEQVAA